MELIILTGLSGSGKSVALRALEDSGYYCIDNLPATLLPQIMHHLEASQTLKVAISVDSRSAALEALPIAMEKLRLSGIQIKVFYLESSQETLVKRFSETRRKHPLSDDHTTLAESISYERQLLAGLDDLGLRIDTSNMSANNLRNHIRQLIAQTSQQLVLLFTSFGFKNGIPLDADFVFDVRSLPNPHYDAELRHFSGRDAPIKAFLSKDPMVTEMYNDIKQYIEKWLPSFNQDNRSYLTIAIGCTGGQHRSVYFVEQLSAYFKPQNVIVRHRELD
jgi:UPF0042 nucleotide-binding protein